ncbi:phycobilisome linker polypeptide [Ancylothrix sp. C2]|uniref:phycobilisome linker polypeptide n=1 Tax=Ancylothrix sp. D3o TaxID=2953691 RepID=UPI0021BA8815|nr:phycobilisome linker polypeptide [Ancylothrix sp. D3o]MCT7948759.1 phycobilisome linker polypeptide [Ancylothrix sp. D3o]
MLGQAAYGKASNSLSASRYYRYEVVGLAQNDQTDKRNFPIRNSGSVFITVPYSKMNEEMQRITRLGGKIVNITAINGDEVSHNSSEE